MNVLILSCLVLFSGLEKQWSCSGIVGPKEIIQETYKNNSMYVVFDKNNEVIKVLIINSTKPQDLADGMSLLLTTLGKTNIPEVKNVVFFKNKWEYYKFLDKNKK